MSTAEPARADVFAPIRVEGAVERIVRRLGEGIGSGILAPGERLPPEAELADMLGVAPMTLRQALAVLREAGYVETRRGRGAGSFVAADVTRPLARGGHVPTREELRDLVDWRRAVSGEAALLAAERCDAAARERIAEAAATADARVEAPFADYRLADSGFHLAIAEASGSRRLLAAERSIQAEFGEILAALPGRESATALRASTTGHAPIVAGLLAGDPERARRGVEDHVEAIFDWIVGLRIGRLETGP